MGRNYLRAILSFGLLLVVAGSLLAQDAQEAQDSAQDTPGQNAPTPAIPQKSSKTFIVNGKTIDAQVLDIDGHPYIDIDSLTQIALITNGSITVEPNRIILTLPASPAPTSNASGNAPDTGSDAATSNAPTEAAPPPEVSGLTKGFVTVAIGVLAEMREWRGATATMVTYGLAVSEAWANGYHDRAQDGLMQATLAAATNDDRQSLGLLTNEFNALAQWSGDELAVRQALNGAQTIDPNALQNDQTLAKIDNCGAFLSSMLLSRMFSDNAGCH